MAAATVARSDVRRQVPPGCVHGFRYRGPADSPRAGSECEQPVSLACLRCGLVVTVDCHSTRTRQCSPCGFAYRERVRRVARVYRDGLLLVTLTAPGMKGHKRQAADGSWRACDCWKDSPRRGVKLDRSASMAAWNASLGNRWNRFLNNGVR